MTISKVWSIAFVATLIAGCGGDGGSTATYSFVTPKVNSVRIYAYTTLDNSNNTINQTFRDTVTSVAAEGSYVAVHNDPSGNSITVNGTTYSITTESLTVNTSGQTLASSYTSANGAPVSCAFAPHAEGADYSLFIGKTWTLNYSRTCGTTTQLFAQTGSVVGVESVTVPAGTYSTIKLQSTLTWTNSTGTTHTEAITTWRDASTAIVVKQVTNTAYSGTALQNGYPVTTTKVLQSQL